MQNKDDPDKLINDTDSWPPEVVKGAAHPEDKVPGKKLPSLVEMVEVDPTEIKQKRGIEKKSLFVNGVIYSTIAGALFLGLRGGPAKEDKNNSATVPESGARQSLADNDRPQKKLDENVENITYRIAQEFEEKRGNDLKEVWVRNIRDTVSYMVMAKEIEPGKRDNCKKAYGWHRDALAVMFDKQSTAGKMIAVRALEEVTSGLTDGSNSELGFIMACWSKHPKDADYKLEAARLADSFDKQGSDIRNRRLSDAITAIGELKAKMQMRTSLISNDIMGGGL